MSAWFVVAITSLPVLAAVLVSFLLARLARAKAVDSGVALAIGACVTGASVPGALMAAGLPMPHWLPLVLALAAVTVCAATAAISVLAARRADAALHARFADEVAAMGERRPPGPGP